MRKLTIMPSSLYEQISDLDNRTADDETTGALYGAREGTLKYTLRVYTFEPMITINIIL